MRGILALSLLLPALAAAQPSFEACGAVDQQFGAGTTQLDVPIPTVSDGWLMLMFGDRTDDAGAWDSVTGWTAISECSVADTTAEDHEAAVWYRVANSDSGTVAVTHTDTMDQGWGAGICAYSGVDQSTPLDQTSVVATQQDTDDGDPGAITTQSANSTVVVIDLLRAFQGELASATPSTNYTERLESDDANFTVYVEDRTIASAGAEDPGAITSGSSAGTNDHIICTVALKAAAASSALLSRRRHAQ